MGQAQRAALPVKCSLCEVFVAGRSSTPKRLNLSLRRETRFCKKTVREQLLADCRNRCCLARHTRILGEPALEAVPIHLDLHHQIYYSLGGPPSEENLVPICPNCHRLIHDHPELYPVASVRKQKARWVAAARVVQSELWAPMGLWSHSSDVRIMFHIESLNLSYAIYAPAALPVGALAEFIFEGILSPLADHLGRAEWANPDIRLALRTERDAILPAHLSVGEIGPKSELEVVAYFPTWGQYAIRHDRPLWFVVVDTTGSMHRKLESVRDRLTQMAASLSKAARHRSSTLRRSQ